jgi:hypothetical protein
MGFWRCRTERGVTWHDRVDGENEGWTGMAERLALRPGRRLASRHGTC